MRKAVGIVGLPGAGKSTALEVAKEYGKVFVMGDVIREETKSRGLEMNSENLGTIAKKLRKEHGKQVVAKKTIEKMKQSSSEFLIIDGIRSMNEVELFEKSFDLEIIAITAPDDKRIQWLVNRKRVDDSQSLEKIKARDKREIQFGVNDVIENADYTIRNNKTKKDLKRKIKDLFEKIKGN